ncbi:hypothetical protein T12_1026 [Trichinella patagoniensis]|uniref:Uncharacterized protein n=1 Tax=Trichinella patagoniensis TaxID=990121 RepID=A0A0V0ZDT5_9BILA|nr:hypothetical protein T12_1026 [Trichinella patagoniensis]
MSVFTGFKLSYTCREKTAGPMKLYFSLIRNQKNMISTFYISICFITAKLFTKMSWISVFKNQKKYIISLKLSIFNFYKEKMSPVDTASTPLVNFVLLQMHYEYK